MFDSGPAIFSLRASPDSQMSVAGTNSKSLRILDTHYTKTAIIALHHGRRHARKRHAHLSLSDENILGEGLLEIGNAHTYKHLYSFIAALTRNILVVVVFCTTEFS